MSAAPFKPFVVKPEPPRRFSMSFLRAAEGCHRRAHLDRTAGIPSDGDALVGSLFHDCVAAIGFTATMSGRERLSADEAVAIARGVLQRGEGPMPRAAHREALALVARWASRVRFRPGEVYEILSEQPLAGYRLSARLDRYYRDESIVEVRDYKTGWADVGTQLTMQGEVYAWHVFERDPAVELVIYDEDHVRFGAINGPYEITRDDVYDAGGIEQFLLDSLARLDAAYKSGRLEATPGSACSRPSACPHAQTCPVPEWARPDTTVATEAEALEVFASLLVQEQRRGSDVKRLRGWMTKDGRRALQLDGEEIGHAQQGGQALDKKLLAADIEAGVEIVDLADYMKSTNATFGRRKAT